MIEILLLFNSGKFQSPCQIMSEEETLKTLSILIEFLSLCINYN